MSVREPSGRDDDLARILKTYERYREQGRHRLWDPSNPGFARMMRDRDVALIDLLQRSLPQRGRVLDLGFGDGRLAAVARGGGVSFGTWTGVDLDPASVAAAAAQYPWATFHLASGDALPFSEASFDVVVATTLFSSLPSARLEQDVAAEIERVLDRSGWLVWYDLRYGNPRNRDVHGLGRGAIGRLFPGWHGEMRSISLLPPVARRLGVLTPLAYAALESIPAFRSHLIGRLRRPA